MKEPGPNPEMTQLWPRMVLVYTCCPSVNISSDFRAPEVLLRLHPMRESSSPKNSLGAGPRSSGTIPKRARWCVPSAQ